MILIYFAGPGDGSSISQAAVITIVIASILVGLALITVVAYCYLRRRKGPRLDTFHLLDNDASDFVNANNVSLGDAY